jgi:hypothetical protein
MNQELLMPKHVIYRRDLGLLLWKPQGSLDEKTVNEIIWFLKSVETRVRRPLNRFSDLTALREVEVNFKYVFHVALYRRLAYARRGSIKSAFLVTNPEAAHYVKLHAMLTDRSPIHVSIFETPGDAAGWLEVPATALRIH